MITEKGEITLRLIAELQKVPAKTIDTLADDEVDPDDQWLLHRSEGDMRFCTYMGNLRALARAARLARQLLNVADPENGAPL